MPTKLIVDCSTGETTEIELTAEEIVQQEADAIKSVLASKEVVVSDKDYIFKVIR